jgi:hypothetical protein
VSLRGFVVCGLLFALALLLLAVYADDARFMASVAADGAQAPQKSSA